MILGEACNREVIIVERSTSALEAAKLMRIHHVGDLVVTEPRDGEQVPVGIITDRDLVLEVLAEELDPETVTVGDVMAYQPVTAHERDDLERALEVMRSKAIRRLPVVNERGGLVGLITVDDILELLAEQMTDLARLIGRQAQREQKLRP